MRDLYTSPTFLAFVVAAALVEWFWRTRVAHGPYDTRAAAASVGVAVGQVLAAAASALVIAQVYVALHALAPASLPLDDGRVWIAGFFAMEFAYYWMHRCSHEIRWMWATHAVHHSSEHFAFHAAVRLGWTNLFSGGWLFFTPLILLGFDPAMIVALLAFNLKYQFLLHTELIGRLGPLEWILNTPAHHRVHHASNAPYLDRNYGGVLIVFDRLFGTFAAEQAEAPLRYGLVEQLKSFNPAVIAFHEWFRMGRDLLQAPSWRGRVLALIGRPGAVKAPPQHRGVEMPSFRV